MLKSLNRFSRMLSHDQNLSCMRLFDHELESCRARVSHASQAPAVAPPEMSSCSFCPCAMVSNTLATHQGARTPPVLTKYQSFISRPAPLHLSVHRRFLHFNSYPRIPTSLESDHMKKYWYELPRGLRDYPLAPRTRHQSLAPRTRHQSLAPRTASDDPSRAAKTSPQRSSNAAQASSHRSPNAAKPSGRCCNGLQRPVLFNTLDGKLAELRLINGPVAV